MNFEFSFGIGGKLGETIEQAIFRSAERNEELNRLRHEVDMARERQQLAQYSSESTKTPMTTAVDPFTEWLHAMRGSQKGSNILGLIADYYGGWERRIPYFYVGKTAEEAADQFIFNEKFRGDNGREFAEKIEKLVSEVTN